MSREEGSRWDVGTKDDVITLERFGDDDERVSEDVLQVDEARELAALLTKHADKIDSKDSKDSKDSDKKDDDKKNDDKSDKDKSEKDDDSKSDHDDSDEDDDESEKKDDSSN